MFKERSTDKLIAHIQSLPHQEQKLIVKSISAKAVDKTTGRAKSKLSSLKGKVSGTTNAKINNRIKALRDEWQSDI